MQVQSLGWEDSLQKGTATYSSILAWKIPWTEKPGGPHSMGFSRQEYWSGLPCPPPGDLPHTGIKPSSLGSPALAGRSFTAEPAVKPHKILHIHCKIKLV